MGDWCNGSICADGGMVDATGSNPVVREGVWVQVPLGAPCEANQPLSKCAASQPKGCGLGERPLSC